MKNSGEFKLNLPALPSGNRGWRWQLSVSETRRYSASSHPGKWYPNSSYFTVSIISDDAEQWSSSEEEISMDWDYDKIISTVQEQVNDLYDRWSHRDTQERTAADAVRHIVDTFVKDEPVKTKQPNWVEYFSTY